MYPRANEFPQSISLTMKKSTKNPRVEPDDLQDKWELGLVFFWRALEIKI